MTAPAYPHEQVHFGPAEYLTTEDLLRMQRDARASVIDFAMGSGFRADENATRYAQGYVHAYGGGAPVYNGTARTVTNFAGQVFVDSDVGGAYSTGYDNQLRPYWLAADELLTQVAVGDATNPRIDLISFKLTYDDTDSLDEEDRFAEAVPGVVTTQIVVKRRKVVLTKAVTAGTPAATPAQPATPSGYRPWAAVYVPATHNAVFTHDQIRDLRRPAGYDANLTIFGDLDAHVHSPGATAWTVNAGGYLETIAASKVVTVFPRLRARHNARFLGLRIMAGIPDTTCAIQLVRRSFAGGVPADTNIGTSLSAGLVAITSSALYTRPDDEPLWGNGWSAGVASYVQGAGHCTALGVKFTSGATPNILNAVEWLFAAA